jgi:hypothetical protein
MSGDVFGTSSFTMTGVGQALVAEKKFERDLPTGGGTKITEKTTLKIYHQPRH